MSYAKLTADEQMTVFLHQLSVFIGRYGVPLEKYEHWVSHHEAAHAIVTLHYGGRVEAIETSPQLLGTAISRARCRSKPPANNLYTLHGFAAGSAYDELHAQRFGIPPELLQQVSQDRNDAMTYMAQIAHDKIRTNVLPAMWGCAVQEMKRLLQQGEIAAKVERLGKAVFDAMQSGRDLSESDIQTACAS